MNVLTKNKPAISSLAILLVIILGSVPTQLVMALSQEESLQDEDTGVNILRGTKIEIPRLIKKRTSQISGVNSSFKTINNSDSISRFTIGQQIGIGGGNVQIRDSFNLTSTEFLNTQNSLSGSTGLPTEQEASRTISNIPDFTRQELLFNISEVIAEPDWRLRENRVGTRTWDSDPVSGDDFHHIAMSFNVSEDYANLTSVRIRISLYAAGSGPSGLIYITNASGGAPDVNLTNKVALVQSVAWRTYTFSENITLEKGQTYFVVMESTFSDTNNYWIWNYEFDDDYETDGGDVYRRRFGGGWGSETGTDLPLQIQVLPVEPSGAKKTYGSANDIEILYNTTAGERRLTSFSWFDANTTEKHNFISNTSVSFTLNFIGNFTYTTAPITGITSYSVQNNSVSFWNITFSTAKVSTNYSVENHLISIKEIPSDWNGTKIYWNDSLTPEYLDLTNNVNITWDGDPAHKYAYGNTTMVVNTSTLVDNTTWHVWLEALNYFLAFNLSRGGQYLDFPYKANVTDTLGLNFQVSESGGNTSYWIEDFNQQAIHNRTDFISADFSDIWIINDNVSQTTNVNGTYELQAFWINSGKIKVGTITRNLDIYINTTLSFNSSSYIDVIIGEKLTLWANYTSNHNSTPSDLSHINNAKIWCNASWPDGTKSNVTMNMPVGTYYNASFDTSGQNAGETGNITITTQLAWFVNWTKIIYVTFIEDSTLVLNNNTDITLQWRENTTLELCYNDSSGTPINGAIILVDGDNDNPAVYNPSLGAYYYQLNSTQYNGVEDYLNLNITAERIYYVNQTIFFNLTITPADSEIGETSITPVDYPIDIANGSVFYFWVVWRSKYGDPLNDSDGVSISHSEVILDSTDPTVGNHTFKFVPTTIGPINVTLTFQTSNYLASIFNINITSIESTSIAVNETDVILKWRENTTLEIWYNDSSNTPIPGATIIVDGDIGHPAVYNPGSGAYLYNLNSTRYSGVGGYLNLNITAQRTYYANQTLYFNLTLNPADSSIASASIDPVDYPLDLTNGSAFYFWVIWLDEYGDPLNDSNGVAISSSDVVLNSTDPATGNHTFKFVPTTIGPINVILTFQFTNYYLSAFFQINVTSIEDTSIAVNETDVILKWRENTTLQIWYNDSSNTPIPGATIIVDGDTAHPAVYEPGSGAYLYQLNSTRYSGVGSYLNLNITAQRTYYANQTLYFNLTINPADSSIASASVDPIDYPLDLTNGSAFYFWVIWFNEYGDPLNDSNGVAISSSDVVLNSTDPATGNHTFKFVPTTIGPINVTLTFQINNYNSIIFHINITSIEGTSIAVNETDVILKWRENTTLQIWYNDSSNTPISVATIIVDGDIGHPAVYDPGSGAYLYKLNSTRYSGVGGYLNLNITAQRTYYLNQTLYFNLTINPADSSIASASVDPGDYPLDLTNGSAFFFWVIWLDEYGDPLNDSNGVAISSSDVVLNSTDPATGNHTFKFVPTTIGPINVTLTFQFTNYYLSAFFQINVTSIENTSIAVNETIIVLKWRENTTLQIWYNDSSNTPIPGATIIVDGDMSHPAVYDSGSGAYLYQLNSTRYSGVGGYLNLNITTQRTYYANQTLYFNLTINPADSSIASASIDPGDYPLDLTNGSAFFFWVIWLDEYGDPLNDSNGVAISSSDVVLNSTDPATGNHTFKFVPTTIGPINVTLTFQYTNYYLSAFFQINVTSIENTSIVVNETIIVLKWRENTTLQIWYNDSINTPIPGATIVVDGDIGHPAVYDSDSGAYLYQLNSTRYSGVGGYLNLNITAQRTYYLNQTLYFNLTINPADSSIASASVDPIDYPLDLTNGTAYYFWVIWLDEYGDPLNDSNGVDISSTDVLLDSTDSTTGNHTLKFVPTTIGPINVTLTFQYTNYYLAAIFHINVTSIESTSITINATNIVLKWRENTTLEIWYNDSTNTPIPSATILVDGDFSHPAIFNPSSGAYYYKLNSTQYNGEGDYRNLNITAQRTYYANQTHYFNLTINLADSSITDASVDPVDYPLDLTNGTVYIFWVIWLDEYGDPLNDSNGVDISSTDVLLDSTDLTTGNHTFKFVPTTIGPINVTLTFQINNYNTAIFHINITSIESTSMMVNETIIVVKWRENTTFEIWYNDSSNTPIDGATIIVDGDIGHPAVYDSGSGAYYYQLNSTQYSGVGDYLNLNITAQRTYYANQALYFNLTINPANSSIDDASIKLYPELNNIQSEENFEFWLIWVSEYNEFLNASDGVLINGTLNNHPDLYLYGTDASTGNHSFMFFYSGTAILTYNLTFLIENYARLEFLIHINIYNRTMVIDDGLSNPMSGQSISFLQYGEVYYFTVFINDSTTKLPLNATVLVLPENISFLGYTVEGNHSFRYNASQIGIFQDLIIVFTFPNYNSVTYNISFVVSPREMILDSNRSTQQSIDYLHYGDNFYFIVYLNDSRTGAPLNITMFSNLIPNLYFENFSFSKGHLFRYQSLEIGDFIFEINFTKQYYNNYTHDLIFNISKANSELIPSTTLIEIYYSDKNVFSLMWQSIPNPNVNTSPILSISNTSNILIQPSSPEWFNNIIIANINNGNYSFIVIADRVGTVIITIFLYSYNFDPEPISIDILLSIDPLPTFEPQINYQPELIVGTPLIISCNEWYSIYNKSVPISEMLLFNGSISIDYIPINTTDLPFIISIDTEEFRQGFYNFTIKIMSYAHENHSLNVVIEIIGRDMLITIEVLPEILTQGSDFTIRVIITYMPLENDFSGFGSGLTLAPLGGVLISFLVKIKYENGTTITLLHNTTTNTAGIAEFTITSKYTHKAEGIESITVTSSATASGKETTQSTSPNFFDNHRFKQKTSGIPEELIIIGILIFILTIGMISLLGISTIRKGKQRQQIVEDSISSDTKPEKIPEKTPDIRPVSIPKDTTPEKAIVEVERYPTTEDITKIKEIKTVTEEPKVKIHEIEEPLEPSPWINLFPPPISECEKEIKYLFNLVIKREGRWHGRTSYNYLLKHKSDDISTTNLRKVYMILPQQTSYFEREKTSIIITEEGKIIASRILKGEN